MAYRIAMSEHGAGMDMAECTWGDRIFTVVSRHGASMALARKLQRAGAPDGPWEVVDYRTGARRLVGRSLHTLAGMSVQEGSDGTPRIVAYRPYPAGLHRREAAD